MMDFFKEWIRISILYHQKTYYFVYDYYIKKIIKGDFDFLLKNRYKDGKK